MQENVSVIKEKHHIRVCLVDDHQIVLEGLMLLIESAEEMACVFTANSASEALSMLNMRHVDVMLLDIELPDMDGIAFCRLLKERFPDIRVIALTMYNERSLIKRMIEAGAEGYLLKNVDRDELLTAIRRVWSGKSHYSAEITDVLVRGNAPSKTSPYAFPSLSGREKQIVRLIMEECTSPQIADKLNISLNTVETHRRNIMHKLNTRNTAGIVRMVMEHGLLEENTDSSEP